MAYKPLSINVFQRVKTLGRSLFMDPAQLREDLGCTCQVCGYKGRFYSFGNPMRRAARCPECFSLERHRLYAMLFKARPDLTRDKSMLHFAPEPAIAAMMDEHAQPSVYITADIQEGLCDLTEDMTALSLEDGQCDCAMANHVLEHIHDDVQAMREVFRVLKSGGVFLCSVPIVDGWERSYEDYSIESAAGRHRHYAQYNHVRMYGRDFITRLESAGFSVELYQASPSDCIAYGLKYGETIFICTKP